MLVDFTHFEPLVVQIRLGVFLSKREHEKGTQQKVTERLYFTYLRGISSQPNLTKIGVSVGVADIINLVKFGNDGAGSTKL